VPSLRRIVYITGVQSKDLELDADNGRLTVEAASRESIAPGTKYGLPSPSGKYGLPSRK